MEAIIRFFTKYETVEQARMIGGHARYWTEQVAVGPDYMTIAGVLFWIVSGFFMWRSKCSH